MQQEKHIIDATGKPLGRLAAEVAKTLRGKHIPGFRPHILPVVRVMVTNAAKVKVTGKKSTDKTYKRYSGYPGGLVHEKMDYLVARKGYRAIIEHAVKGMLPTNKLRSKIMKNLTVSE